MASYRKNHKRTREEEETFSPSDNGRDTLHNQDRVPVAYAPQGLRPMADRVLLLPQVEVRGCDRGHYGHPVRPFPQGRGPQGQPQSGDHRLPQRQDLASRRPVLQRDRREQEDQRAQGTHCG